MLVKAILAVLLATLLQAGKADELHIELMTYPEVASALQAAKTTLLIVNGGTEQRGPHAVLGGHTLIAGKLAEAIAQRLGNALIAPVLPYSPAAAHLNPRWPGTVTISEKLFSLVNEAVVESMVVNGFKNIILMGDHGGGQATLAQLASSLNQKYRSRGAHVYYCGAAYYAATQEFDRRLVSRRLPVGKHAAIEDTSEMMYLGADRWVRKDKIGPARNNNGINGDPRPSTEALGKEFFELRVDYAVNEIEKMIRSGH